MLAKYVCVCVRACVRACVRVCCLWNLVEYIYMSDCLASASPWPDSQLLRLGLVNAA